MLPAHSPRPTNLRPQGDRSPKRFVGASGPNWPNQWTWCRKNAGGVIARMGTSPIQHSLILEVCTATASLRGAGSGRSRTRRRRSTTTSLAHGRCTQGRLAGGVYPCDRWSACGRLTRPSDWVRLVETYRRVASNEHSGWELPGPNHHLADIRPLWRCPARAPFGLSVAHHILPNWEALAHDYQGVHLSWAGFLTTEGYVSDLADGGATMLRYWSSERTMWLEDVFGDPEPLDAPELTGRVGGTVGLDASSGDEAHLERDREEICARLGR